MPVTVSLEELILLADSRPLWPGEFVAFVEKLEGAQKVRDDRTTWGVLADWLDEQGESRMASACRWVANRPKVRLVVNPGHRSDPFKWEGIPSVITSLVMEGEYNQPDGVADRVVYLGRRLEQVAELMKGLLD